MSDGEAAAAGRSTGAAPPEPTTIPPDQLRAALDVVGLAFSDDELALAGARAGRNRGSIERLRAAAVDEGVGPALRFDPRLPGIRSRPPRTRPADLRLPDVERPDDLEALAWAPIPELAALVRGRLVSCVELAIVAIDRLRRADSVLRCVVSYTESRALAQAGRLDAELAAGHWRGPLHGIPWGAKDLLAVRGQPTTWGTPPYADQLIDGDAAVVERLDAAGAVLVAKLSLGELAWGDVWTGGRTANPWDPAEGASGSSAGSAAAVAAGAVPFSIGSETLGSIVSPARICGVTGLRPTFGRVSRFGAMALAWTMDRLGPLTRSAEDAAIVFGAIAGRDDRDDTAVDASFHLPAEVDPRGWRIGVVEAAFGRAPALVGALDELRSFGCELVPVALPAGPIDDLRLILDAEAAAAFDELTRSGRLREMIRQEEEAWPNVFRAARLIPAVEYLHANRLRRALVLEIAGLLDGVDLLVHPTDDDPAVTLENVTGHPAVALPWGARENGAPESITLVAPLDAEADLLGFAAAWQGRTEHHRRRPPA